MVSASLLETWPVSVANCLDRSLDLQKMGRSISGKGRVDEGLEADKE